MEFTRASSSCRRTTSSVTTRKIWELERRAKTRARTQAANRSDEKHSTMKTSSEDTSSVGASHPKPSQTADHLVLSNPSSTFTATSTMISGTAQKTLQTRREILSTDSDEISRRPRRTPRETAERSTRTPTILSIKMTRNYTTTTTIRSESTRTRATTAMTKMHRENISLLDEILCKDLC